VGFEPTRNKALDLKTNSLTTRTHPLKETNENLLKLVVLKDRLNILFEPCSWRELNTRLTAYKAVALPLSYKSLFYPATPKNVLFQVSFLIAYKKKQIWVKVKVS